jgi:hypothetical protein
MVAPFLPQRLYPIRDQPAGIVCHFFVPIRGPGALSSGAGVNPLCGSLLLPLSKRTIHELLSVHLLRPPARAIGTFEAGTTDAIVSAMTVFPAHPRHAERHEQGPPRLDCKYCVILHPGAAEAEDDARGGTAGEMGEQSNLPTPMEVPTRIGATGPAWGGVLENGTLGLLLEVLDGASEEDQARIEAQEAADEEDKGKGKMKTSGRSKARSRKAAVTKWDPTLIGNFCRWRGCLDACTGGGAVGAKNVCLAHGEVKQFLDRRSGVQGGKNTSESSRYLIRKPPSDGHGQAAGSSNSARAVGLEADLAVLLHASSLLQVG